MFDKKRRRRQLEISSGARLYCYRLLPVFYKPKPVFDFSTFLRIAFSTEENRIKPGRVYWESIEDLAQKGRFSG
jgi:hypothetical protein